MLIGILTILTVVFIETPVLRTMFLRSILGFLLIIFMSGYALMAALFPRRGDLDTPERLALSFGLSITVTSLIGLALNYTPLGIRLTPILLLLSVFTLIMILMGLKRRSEVDAADRFSVNFSLKPYLDRFRGESRGSQVLSAVLILLVVVTVSATVYTLMKPHQGPNYTEFYILGTTGKVMSHPDNLTVGETARVTVGMVNHEHRNMTYLFVVKSNNRTVTQRNVTLAEGAKLEFPYYITGEYEGKKEVKFFLYRLPDDKVPYGTLHIGVNVV